MILYLPISFQDYGIIFKKIKGIWDYSRDPPSRASYMPSQFFRENRGTRTFTSGEQGTKLGSREHIKANIYFAILGNRTKCKFQGKKGTGTHTLGDTVEINP